MATIKSRKITKIVREFVKQDASYDITGVDLGLAKYLWRVSRDAFQDLAAGDYRIDQSNGKQTLVILNAELLAQAEAFQVGYVLDFTASEYDTEWNVDINQLKEKYNTLVQNTQSLWEYVRLTGFIADDTTINLILPQLDDNQFWFYQDGKYKAYDVSDFRQLGESLIEAYAEYQKSVIELMVRNARENIQNNVDNGAASIQNLLNSLNLSVENFTGDKKLELQKIINDFRKELEVVSVGNANTVQGYVPTNFDRVENTIKDLQNSKKYKIGDVLEVLGYYTAGDGAGHKRKIEATDDGSGVRLANGLWANIVHNGEVNVSWFGVRGDATLSNIIIHDYENDNPVNCKEWGGTEFNYVLEKIFNNKNINVVNFNKENYFCGSLQTIIDKNNVPISVNRGNLIINGNGCNLIGGIYLECLNEDIENVTIKNMNILGRTQGFKPTTVVKEYISHEVFSTRYGYSYNGILLNPNDTTNKSIRNIFIHNCNFDTLMSGVGGGILDSPRYGISSVVVDSCTSNNLWWHGVGVRNTEFLKVTNCDFNFHVVGMMTDFSQRTRYSIMDNCSGTNVSQLCKFEDGANNNIVSNCIYIKKAQNLCDAVRYVFRIAGDNNTITNCKIDATSLPDNYLNISQIQFGTGNIIKNNDIKITQQHAIAYALIRIETSQTEDFTLDIEDNKIELINEKFNNPTSPFFQSLVILQSEISCFININNNSYKGKNIGGLIRLADSVGLSKIYRINLCNNYTTSILCHLRTKTSSDGFFNIRDNVIEFDREIGDNVLYLFNFIMKISISNNIIKNQTSNNINGAVIQTESGNEYLNVKMDNNRFYDTYLPISLPINSAKIVDIINNIFYSKADFTVISKYATVFDIFRFSNNSLVNIGTPSKIQLTNKGFSNVENNILNNCSLNLPSALTLEEPII